MVELYPDNIIQLISKFNQQLAQTYHKTDQGINTRPNIVYNSADR